MQLIKMACFPERNCPFERLLDHENKHLSRHLTQLLLWRLFAKHLLHQSGFKWFDIVRVHLEAGFEHVMVEYKILLDPRQELHRLFLPLVM